jgi:hypothetical protein
MVANLFICATNLFQSKHFSRLSESFVVSALNYQEKAYLFFTRNSQNDVNENTKNGVRLIGCRIWMILSDFVMLKK